MSPAKAVRETDRQHENWLALQQSPENARCGCGNVTRFAGIDDRGYGGPEDCECGAAEHNETAPIADWRECSCISRLTQPYDVMRDQAGDVVEFDYHLFTGGGWDATIAEYTRIQCGDCGKELYRSPDLRDDEAAP